ncbi:Gfo/Idh/MocA family protein [Thermosipho atlanticus]|uniref:Predicted dehydrogenase n=1 Tax=Thermosipho atlanticus DSM 15807 TaxID=1123380 RepID=A0A1M5QMQ3_9BACT|nr:Gfo/Idh/MocA family oxidoreductase [Thermosipho atlanticus]SHH15131.1 Predicted dehydrogenase [Thermosipho atlanticus DSM 15807]
MRKIRLGIVGCGIAAKELHWPILKELRDKFEITAVNSRTRKHAEEFAKLVGSPEIFDTYEELLDSGVIEAVDLTIPIELNVQFTEKAILKNIHVICEKPISTDVETGKILVNLAKQTDKVIYIAENWRHIKKYYKVKEVLSKIGKPLYFNWKIWIGMDRNNKYAQTEWRKTPKHIGGFLSDGGVHHVAAMRLIFGDIKWVSAITKKHASFLGGPDFLEAVFEFENQVVGNYTVSYAIKSEETFEVIGTIGKIKLEGNKIIVNDEIIEVEENMGYKEEFEDFYEIILGVRKNELGSPEEALKDLAFFEAALKSNGDRIDLTSLL